MVLSNSKRMFGEILLTEGVLQKEQLDAALAEQSVTGLPLGQVLLRQGLISEAEIVRTLSIQYNLPFLLPSAYEVRLELLKQMSPKVLYQNRLVPLDRFGDSVVIAIGDIPSTGLQKKLVEAFGKDIFYVFAPLSDIETILRGHFAYSQEDLVQMDALRDGVEPKQKPVDSALFEGFDASSWENIFDEAEQNL